jgi:hypothetical protein
MNTIPRPDGAVLLAPLVHMNGTGHDTLIEGYLAAASALSDALDALQAAAPNARDYYPQGDDAYRQARAEHDRRANALRQVQAELQMLAENVQEQIDARG